MTKFSVLISVYIKENPEYFKLAMKSLFTQTLQPDEIILIKDGQLTDELNNIIYYYIDNYPDVLKIVSLEQNVGLGNALNRGLEICSYDIIARMDSDDIALPERFEKQMNFLNNNQDIDVLGTWMKEFDSDTGKVYGARILPEKHEDIVKFMKKRNGISHPSVMFRKNKIIEAGKYQHYPLYEDYHLWIRVLNIGGKFHNLQEYLMLFRSGKIMIKRRGGVKYLLTELRFQLWLHRNGVINSVEMLVNSLKRVFIRIGGKQFRYFMYKKYLRKSINE